MKQLFANFKTRLKKVLFAKGRVLPIIKGPLKGYRYFVKSDVGFASVLGGWEKKSQLVYQGSIFKNFIVFDVGANFGIHSLLYSKLVGEKGKVFAFEPLPENIGDIRKNLALNNITNVTIIDEAVSSENGKATFHVASAGGEGSLVDIVDPSHHTGRSFLVDTTTLDDFCKSENVYPDFVKIDIEGAEGYALSGYDKCIEKSFPFFAIDLHTPECDRAAGSYFAKHGYEVYRVNDSSRKTVRSSDKLLERIEFLDQTWPNPKGIWGVIWCVHPSRKHMVEHFIAENS